MQIGLQIPDFTTPDGPARLGADLGTVARTADEAGFGFIAVMDHFFQIGAIGAVANVWQVTPLEVIASDVIPAVASL